MKLVGLFAVLFVVAFSSIKAEDDADIVGDKVPAEVVLAAIQDTVKEGAEFVAVDNVVAAVDSKDDLDENPLLRGIFKKCKSADCRKKCNAKGKNGTCIWIKCVCWK